ncbi:hypothetical protein GCM10017764_02920 [Sphingobacterium griseoflavum]|uniref:Uncharacterized protein n=1 Tax=Sphingobacterium griseoflavum TaxID=1474952 RepID=A0ABQ3HSX2_9SPHI|nr:hypothetical protein GCM10017764_02920 [Sphingobacterium griseoflavum]
MHLLLYKDTQLLADFAQDIGGANHNGKTNKTTNTDGGKPQYRRVRKFFLMGLYHNDQQGDNGNPRHVHDVEETANKNCCQHTNNDHIQ